MSYNDEKYEGTTMTLTFEGLDDSKDGQVLSKPIEILAWSFGNSAEQEEGKTLWKTHFQNFSLTKYVSIHSPILFKYVGGESTIKYATLVASNKSQTITYKLQDVNLTSLMTGGSGGETNLTENLTFTFKKVEQIVEDKAEPKNGTSTSEVLTNQHQYTSSHRRY